MFLNFLKYKKSNKKAGDLRVDSSPIGQRNSLDVPVQFISPRRIDSRDMCLTFPHEIHSDHCAGYSAANYISYWHWRYLHYPSKINGDEIYNEAKKIDGNSLPGTTIYSVAKASIKMGLIKGVPQYVDYPSINAFDMTYKEKRIMSIKFALHRYGVVLGGFLITNEWNYIDKNNGMIANFKDSAFNIGGHAVLICGYDYNGIYIKNSWGKQWGHYGFAVLGWEQFHRQISQAVIINHSQFYEE